MAKQDLSVTYIKLIDFTYLFCIKYLWFLNTFDMEMLYFSSVEICLEWSYMLIHLKLSYLY